VDKREVICYIMMGDTCIDCLVLGSPNLSLQKPVQEHGGAARGYEELLDDERGSNSFEDLPNLDEHEKQARERQIERSKNYNKKTKVTLSDKAGASQRL